MFTNVGHRWIFSYSYLISLLIYEVRRGFLSGRHCPPVLGLEPRTHKILGWWGNLHTSVKGRRPVVGRPSGVTIVNCDLNCGDGTTNLNDKRVFFFNSCHFFCWFNFLWAALSRAATRTSLRFAMVCLFCLLKAMPCCCYYYAAGLLVVICKARAHIFWSYSLRFTSSTVVLYDRILQFFFAYPSWIKFTLENFLS